jgi:LysW-gamma-L-alpha-aminoadipyl-6-phosphate/LysW-L-glutamyl-5-phosphate reductase
MSAMHVAILGASGFGGGELLRLLLNHPAVATLQLVAASNAGKHITAVHPHLRGLIDQVFAASLDVTALNAAAQGVLFAALPHGEFAKLWPGIATQLAAHVCVIDLSGDFRLADATAFASAYGMAHPCPALLSDFQYGVPEFARAALVGCKRISNPGCFATALNLALLPLARLNAAIGPVFISAVTGSSGSGNKPSDGTHHPTRAHDFRAYKVLEHQHQAEVHRCLAAHAHDLAFSLVTHSAPLVRGIFASLQFALPAQLAPEAVYAAYEAEYRDAHFVRLLPDASARLGAVIGSNYCDIAVAHANGMVAVTACLDNLIKGMAGQAIQNMNVAFGLPEQSGLRLAALYP